jgi:hypothetical protein
MKEKLLTGNYFWTKRSFGGFTLWVEVREAAEGPGVWDKKYVKGNLADMNQLGIQMSNKI